MCLGAAILDFCSLLSGSAYMYCVLYITSCQNMQYKTFQRFSAPFTIDAFHTRAECYHWCWNRHRNCIFLSNLSIGVLSRRILKQRIIFRVKILFPFHSNPSQYLLFAKILFRFRTIHNTPISYTHSFKLLQNVGNSLCSAHFRFRLHILSSKISWWQTNAHS